jgi:hypothetical protein
MSFVDHIYAHRTEIPLCGCDRRVAQQPRQSIDVATAPNVGNGEAATEGVWDRTRLRLTAILTAKRTDADGNSELGRTPKSRLS